MNKNIFLIQKILNNITNTEPNHSAQIFSVGVLKETIKGNLCSPKNNSSKNTHIRIDNKFSDIISFIDWYMIKNIFLIQYIFCHQTSQSAEEHCNIERSKISIEKKADVLKKQIKARRNNGKKSIFKSQHQYQ